MPSRVPGRGPLVCTLRQLVQRVDRYHRYRAATADEQRWAAWVFDQLFLVLERAMSDPQVQREITATEQRRAVSRKTRT